MQPGCIIENTMQALPTVCKPSLLVASVPHLHHRACVSLRRTAILNYPARSLASIQLQAPRTPSFSACCASSCTRSVFSAPQRACSQRFPTPGAAGASRVLASCACTTGTHLDDARLAFSSAAAAHLRGAPLSSLFVLFLNSMLVHRSFPSHNLPLPPFPLHHSLLLFSSPIFH